MRREYIAEGKKSRRSIELGNIKSMTNGGALRPSTSQSRMLSIERITTVRPSKGSDKKSPRRREIITRRETFIYSSDCLAMPSMKDSC
jgi:hypothetical protein